MSLSDVKRRWILWCRTGVLTALAGVMLLASRPAVAAPFHSDKGHYTIDLPEGWSPTPPTESGLLNFAMAVTEGGTVNLDACFSPAQSSIASPILLYVVVEPYPRERQPGIGALRNAILANNVSTADDASTKVVFDARTCTFQATERTQRLFSLIDVRTDARGWFGHAGSVTLCLQVPTGLSTQYQPALEQVAKSFRFDAGYGYRRANIFLPCGGLLAIAVTVMWVARRRPEQGSALS